MKKDILILSILLAMTANYALAMSSANYQINSDTINAGGNLSNSANYKTLDSIGETFIGSMASTNFTIGEGLAPMITYSLTMSLDSSTKDLGSVTAGVPITGTTTATVTTDSWGGYDMYISQNDDLKHADPLTTIAPFSCTIAAPCFWSGAGFGFTVNSGTSVEAKWGTSPSYKYAAIPSTTTLFHTKWGYSSGGDNTVIGYKLDVPTTQKSGVYTNIITYTAVAKL
ncbi:MAG: hypothetical protein PHW24_04055 [Candidatus Moranbacteria bacterium]|nr:hypothetical protein [Candidatus Moranbacteria bacterium]